jgi:hypothetical protein
MPLEFEFCFDLLNRRQSTEQAVLYSASSGGRDRTLSVMLCHTKQASPRMFLLRGCPRNSSDGRHAVASSTSLRMDT